MTNNLQVQPRKLDKEIGDRSYCDVRIASGPPRSGPSSPRDHDSDNDVEDDDDDDDDDDEHNTDDYDEENDDDDDERDSR